MHFEIVRRFDILPTQLSNGSVFGDLLVDGEYFGKIVQDASTLIPEGDYDLLPYESPKHGPTVCFHNPDLHVYATGVPVGLAGRSYCEIHEANWAFQLEGCTAVGEEIAQIPPNGWGITNSRQTLARLRQQWGDRSNLTASIRSTHP